MPLSETGDRAEKGRRIPRAHAEEELAVCARARCRIETNRKDKKGEIRERERMGRTVGGG
jgi:hypothetical protein